MRNAILGGLIIASVFSVAASEELVNVKVSAAITSAPADVVVTATVVPDDRNRALMISAESASYMRRSTVELAGEDEARVHQLSLVSLPEGEYIVSAAVIGPDGPRGRAETRLMVFGGSHRRPK